MTKFVVIVGFAVAFAAGLIVGAEMRQSSVASPVTPANPTTQSSTRPSRRGYLPTELNLSAQQQDEMKKIWSDGGGKLREELRKKFEGYLT